MQTTSHSMLLKTLTAISSVSVKITATETTLKCRPCVRCITGQLKSINIVQVGLNYLKITILLSCPRNTCYDSHLQRSLNSQREMKLHHFFVFANVIINKMQEISNRLRSHCQTV